MVFKIRNANLACRRFSGDLILCLPLVINEMLVNALKNTNYLNVVFTATRLYHYQISRLLTFFSPVTF